MLAEYKQKHPSVYVDYSAHNYSTPPFELSFLDMPIMITFVTHISSFLQNKGLNKKPRLLEKRGLVKRTY